MTAERKSRKITTPIFDRFMGSASSREKNAVSEQMISLTEFYEIIRRDLEQLLNTRMSLLEWPLHYTELHRSVATFGIPDFTNLQFGIEKAQLVLCEQIAKLIALHEPRLQQVRVVLYDPNDQIDRVLHLRIEAMINLQPKSTAAVFESHFDIVNQDFRVN